jgi:hypothetical protein
MFVNIFFCPNRFSNRLSILHIETMKVDGFLQSQVQV